MRMDTKTWANFESKTISSNIKQLQRAALRSVLTARSGGDFPPRLKGLLAWMEKTHPSWTNCVTVVTLAAGRPAGCGV